MVSQSGHERRQARLIRESKEYAYSVPESSEYVSKLEARAANVSACAVSTILSVNFLAGATATVLGGYEQSASLLAQQSSMGIPLAVVSALTFRGVLRNHREAKSLRQADRQTQMNLAFVALAAMSAPRLQPEAQDVAVSQAAIPLPLAIEHISETQRVA